MTLLEGFSVDELQDALNSVESKKPTQRLMLAILYKQGPSVPMLAEWFDMRDDTIYRWFREMDQAPLLEAIHDDPPPGRPPKLTDNEREQFETAVQATPDAVGYDAPAWTTKLARRYLDEEFDVEYTPATSGDYSRMRASPSRPHARTHRPQTTRNAKSSRKTSKN